MLPTMKPNHWKSASPKVVPWKPIAPITGIRNAANRVMISPLMKPPATAPRRPPVALPNTPAVPPVKKCGIIPGRIRGTTSAAPRPAHRMPNPTMPPATLARNPIRTAFGANGKAIGQSSAGTAPGITRSAMPANAGTISPRMVRTPSRMTATPPPKRSAWLSIVERKPRKPPAAPVAPTKPASVTA